MSCTRVYSPFSALKSNFKLLYVFEQYTHSTDIYDEVCVNSRQRDTTLPASLHFEEKMGSCAWWFLTDN